MKKLFFQILFFICILGKSTILLAGSTEVLDFETMRSLKENMDVFYVDIIKIQEKLQDQDKADWDAIYKLLGEMQQTVLEMELKDKKKIYHVYTDQLYELVRGLRKMASRKDEKITDKFEAMTNACFGCHATHRRPDVKINNQKSANL
ncbi:MAG: hypothetical protein ACD_73C00638G0004 [uncultured bacterium]|nr:MAG: hypothetical protein ACD_73C00638G0004 [uncultured bacterium]